MTKLKIRKKMFITFHLQTNEQTKRLNEILKQYLRTYINKKQND